MAHPGFGRLWEQPETSDVDIVIYVPNTATPDSSDASKTPPIMLQRFPGHSQILGISPVFMAQVVT